MAQLDERQNEPAQTRPQPASQPERELVEAVVRVYRKYGSDLSAFRRDSEKELKRA